MSAANVGVFYQYSLGSVAEARAVCDLATKYGHTAVRLSQSLRHSPIVAIAAVAAAFPEIRFGTAISLMALTTPTSLAAEARSLNELTGGDFSLGLGVGEPAASELLVGERDPVKASPAYAADYVRAVRSLWLDGQNSYRGSAITASVADDGEFRHWGTRNGEILVAALGPGMAGVARDAGDGIITWLVPPHYLSGTLLPALRGTASSATGRSRSVCLVPAVPSTRRSTARAMLRQMVGPHMSRPHYRRMIAAAGLASRDEDLDVVLDGLLDRVVCWGGEKGFTNRITELTESGCDEIGISAFRSADADSWTVYESTIELAAHCAGHALGEHR
jgi:alkanesulfonate monooxygenase SsuD/methylene tetrahydromethanopterin reductase-like flavin-dependent oxidoreductase (luciferase family)